MLDRDAIVICDGGDFASYAGRAIESYEPGCWLDPGPFGCLGCGPGYALAAKLARPERQVVLLLGDGAFGFSGMEWDTLARHGVGVVGVMGNNGIWGLEKHPMEFLYGYSVVADLRPGTRYDRRRRGARRAGRAGARAGRAQARARARARGRRAGAGERADRPLGRLSALREPRLKTRSRLAAGRGGFKLAPSGRAGVRALGAFGRPRRREAPCMRQSPGSMRRGTTAGGTTALPTLRVSLHCQQLAIVRTSRSASFRVSARGRARRPRGCRGPRSRPRRARRRRARG